MEAESTIGHGWNALPTAISLAVCTPRRPGRKCEVAG